jgi:ABC-type multidrug transport system ATPase subunit
METFMELYVIAGPNGVGKTTFARTFLPKYANCKNFVNADLIAAGMSPFSPEAATIRRQQTGAQRDSLFFTAVSLFCLRNIAFRSKLFEIDSTAQDQRIPRPLVLSVRRGR